MKWKSTLLTLTLPSSSKIFGFSRYAVEAFTYGDCGYLANTLAERTGWKPVTASANTATQWCHAGVQTPNGFIVDIEGIWTVQNWLDRWFSLADSVTSPEEAVEDFLVAIWNKEEFSKQVFIYKRAYPEFDLAEWSSNVLEHFV